MNRSSILIWLGLFLSITGIILNFTKDGLYRYILSRELALSPTSEVFKAWQKTPIPLELDFYFFNWTNPEDLWDDDYKPNLVEVGPYKFKEYYEKANVTRNSNKTLTFKRMRKWIFDEENSNGSYGDQLTTLNPVATAAAYVSRFRNRFVQYTLSSTMGLTSQTVWETRSVEEFLYKGYNNPLLTIAAKASQIAQARLPGDKFAWFYNRNCSTEQEGVFNIETGEDDISVKGRINWWNYKTRTDYYLDECGAIRGSAGDLYAPEQTREKPIQFFSAEFCKTIQYDYARDVEVLGIPGYRYEGGKSLLDSGTIDANNWCNCNGICPLPGVLNISDCRYGAPGFVSYPHFLDADPYYIGKVNGLRPDRERHVGHITLEPKTGTPLSVEVRFQINLLLQHYDHFSLYKNVPTIYFPMLWFEEKIQISPEYAAKVKMAILFPTAALYLSVILLLLGLAMLAFVIIPQFVNKRRALRFPHNMKEKSAEKSADQVVYAKETIQPLMVQPVKEQAVLSPEESSLHEPKDVGT